MAFGKGKQQSYGVPVRAATPAAPAPSAAVDQPSYEYAGGAATPVAAPAAWGAPAPATWGPPPAAAPPPSAWAASPAPPSSWAPPPEAAWAVPAQPSGHYPPAQPPTASNPFAPAQTWSPQPPGYPQQYLAPFAPAPQQSSTGMHKVFKIAGVAIGFLFAIVGGLGFIESRRTPNLPDVLAGRPIATDPAMKEVANKELRSSNGSKATGAVYMGADGMPEIVLVARRGGTDMPRQIEQLESEGMEADGEVVRIGNMTCFSNEQLYMSACLWSARVSGVVMVMGEDIDATAAIAEEAKAALN